MSLPILDVASENYTRKPHRVPACCKSGLPYLQITHGLSPFPHTAETLMLENCCQVDNVIPFLLEYSRSNVLKLL